MRASAVAAVLVILYINHEMEKQIVFLFLFKQFQQSRLVFALSSQNKFYCQVESFKYKGHSIANSFCLMSRSQNSLLKNFTV